MSAGQTACAARSRRFGPFETTLLILVGAGFGVAVFGVNLLHLGDEGFHAPQIWHFFVGRFELLQATTMLPTYHAMLALAERAVGFHHNALLRALNLLGSLLLPVLVWRLVALHSPAEAGRRTVQWFYMPLLFPFYFLIHTDAWALVAVLATALCAVRGRHLLAALAGLAATLLRQDMIIWVAMAWMLVLPGGLSVDVWREQWRRQLLPALVRGAPLLAVIALFALFYVWNGGVAVGDRRQHGVGFNPTNVAGLLFCAWLVFLPQNLEALPRIWALLRRPLPIVLLIAGFALYMGTFANKHELNGAHLRFHLHNEALYWLTRSAWIRALAFVPIAWVVLTLCVSRLAEPRWRVLYLIAPLSAGLHPLIEPRYYLPALTLLQVWRPSAGERWENAALVVYALATPAIMWGIASSRFFL